MWVTHGVPSTVAEMSSSSGPRVSQDSAGPPGMMDGPRSAPSSPPEMPAPTKWRPAAATSRSRRMVSVNRALPPSIMMSPSSIASTSWAITASVAAPAWTMITALRGRWSDATNSSIVSAGMKSPSWPNSSITARVFSGERLKMATVWPLEAKLRARLEPITAIPTTPI